MLMIIMNNFARYARSATDLRDTFCPFFLSWENVSCRLRALLCRCYLKFLQFKLFVTNCTSSSMPVIFILHHRRER